MNYSPVIKDKARSRFMTGEDASSIAKSMKIRQDVLESWIFTEKWDSLYRDRLAAEIHTKGDVIIAQEKPMLVERQVRISQKLDSHIETALDKKKVSSRELVNLSKAAMASVSVAESALQLKRASALQVFVQFNLKPIPVQPAIDLGLIESTPVASPQLSSPDPF